MFWLLEVLGGNDLFFILYFWKLGGFMQSVGHTMAIFQIWRIIIKCYIHLDPSHHKRRMLPCFSFTWWTEVELNKKYGDVCLLRQEAFKKFNGQNLIKMHLWASAPPRGHHCAVSWVKERVCREYIKPSSNQSTTSTLCTIRKLFVVQSRIHTLLTYFVLRPDKRTGEPPLIADWYLKSNV